MLALKIFCPDFLNRNLDAYRSYPFMFCLLMIIKTDFLSIHNHKFNKALIKLKNIIQYLHAKLKINFITNSLSLYG